MRTRFLFVAAVLLALFAPALRAQEAGRLAIPRNQGWVTDLAGMLTPTQRRELDALMESYKQGTTHEIALLTIESLQGEPLEKFANEVGRSWGIGGKEKNNGAILIVSKNDRKIRIETGRGLEGSLPDSMCGRIIREVIAPRFKQGRFGEGLEDGVRAIHAAIGGEYGRNRAVRGATAIGLAAGLVPLVFTLIIIFFVLSRLRGRGGRRGGGGFFLGPWLGGGGFGGFSGGGGGGGGFSGGGFSGFGGGGGFSGGGASGGW